MKLNPMVNVSLTRREIEEIRNILYYLNYKRIGKSATDLSYSERIDLLNKLFRALNKSYVKK